MVEIVFRCYCNGWDGLKTAYFGRFIPVELNLGEFARWK